MNLSCGTVGTAAAVLVGVGVLTFVDAQSRADGPRTNVGEKIRQHCAARNVSGGVLVYLGNPNNALLTDLVGMSDERFLVRGLLSEAGDLAMLRRRLLASGFYGKILERLRLPSLPVWDGMAAADRKIYLSCTDGRVLCLD